jgi:carbon monoxide dehydrogenase subunit G
MEDHVEFTHEFRVPADVDTTFATLMDLEKVAPCMPGAQLDGFDGDTYTGHVKVKVGPIQTVYRGTAKVIEIDEKAKRASIQAKGKETRGTGTAAANVTAMLREEAGETIVTVVSQIDVTGKPAQFGRGIMAEVGEQIIAQFAQRLKTLLESERDGGATGEAKATQDEPQTASAQKQDDALDLMTLAAAATMKRVVPVVVGLVAVALVIWWLVSR